MTQSRPLPYRRLGEGSINVQRTIGGLLAVSALTVSLARADESGTATAPGTPPASDGAPARVALADYLALSAAQSRNFDRSQDISPRQMAILLDVCERTGSSLGQALATGELESAHTWNDHIRPILRNGRQGSATGVWQFQPSTFHRILKAYGERLLAASGADPASGRPAMDLGDGPYRDTEVRNLVRETVDGKRGADDDTLQLLRHNFAVLAFANYYLSLDSGATTPEEDYLFHFLGPGQGKRVLALAQGPARDTLCVKPAQIPGVQPAPGPLPELALGDELAAIIRAQQSLGPSISASSASPEPRSSPPVGSKLPPPPRLTERALALGPAETIGAARWAQVRAQALQPSSPDIEPAVATESAVFVPIVPDLASPVSADWGMPADSPVVTGNSGMFYRDGKGQSQPYTWGEFMGHLGRLIHAADQPALVRAKYGVGFPIKGGDLPGLAFDPLNVSDTADFRDDSGQTVPLPEAMALGTLTHSEMQLYRRDLAALAASGSGRPSETLPPEALAALKRLALLPTNDQGTDASDPQVKAALHGFRQRVGKSEPDDPAAADSLMPAERVALEIYGRRIGHYADLQASQRAALQDSINLGCVAKLPARLQRTVAPSVATLQTALAGEGLLTQPTRKNVWRDKKRRRHVAYEPVPFSGKPDNKTIAALDTYQLRHGLLRTKGVADTLTLGLLRLPPMDGSDFLPPRGPQSALGDAGAASPIVELPPSSADLTWTHYSPTSFAGPSLSERILTPPCLGPTVAKAAPARVKPVHRTSRSRSKRHR